MAEEDIQPEEDYDTTENYDPQKEQLWANELRSLATSQIVSLAQKLATRLNKKIEKGDDNTAFMIALLLAGTKDFLDIALSFLLIGLIPGVSFVIGLFLTTFLFFFMLGKGWFLKWKLRFWYWFLGLFIDGLPLFNLLPINVLLVLYAWRLTKKGAAEAKLKLQDLDTMSQQEINQLSSDLGLLEPALDGK